MWHPFAFFTDIAPIPAINSAPLPASCRLVFREHIIRYFKDDEGNSAKGAKRIVVEQRPGITLERRQAADGWRIDVRHVKEYEVTHTISGSLFCARADLRTPARWQFRDEFSPASPLAPPLFHEGNFQNGNITHTTAPDKNRAASITREIPAAGLVSLYALMADFPDKLPPLPDDTVVMEEAALFTKGAQTALPSPALSNHPFAKQHQLTAQILNYSGGTPIEFWLNKHNTPALVVFSPTRVFRLESVETLK